MAKTMRIMVSCNLCAGCQFWECKSTCIQPNANFSISFITSCVGGTATLTNTSTNTSANTIYKWDIGNDGTIDYTSISAKSYV